jgi:hypothetical protein
VTPTTCGSSMMDMAATSSSSSGNARRTTCNTPQLRLY